MQPGEVSALLPNNVPMLSRHCQPLSEPDSNPRKRLGRKQGRGTQAESWCSLVDVTKVELYAWRQGQSPASRTGRERRLCMCFAGSKNQILQGGVSAEGRGTGGERLRNRGPGQKPCTSTAAPSKCRFEGDSRHLTSDQRGDLSLTPRPQPPAPAFSSQALCRNSASSFDDEHRGDDFGPRKAGKGDTGCVFSISWMNLAVMIWQLRWNAIRSGYFETPAEYP